MRLRSIPLAAMLLAAPALLLALASCVPTSKSPVGDVSKAKFDPDLGGLWRGGKDGGSPYYVSFSAFEEHGVDIAFVEPKSGGRAHEIGRYRGFTTEAGGKRLLSVRVVEESDKKAAGAAEAGPYFVLQYIIDPAAKDRMRLGLWKLDAAKKAVSSGALSGKVSEGTPTDVGVDATPEALASYFAAQKSEECFDLSLDLKRIDGPPAPSSGK